MYGIFGILNEKNVTSTLLQGLQRLENGGYDAISVATVANGRIQWQEAKDLHSLLPELSTGGRFGIAYTSKACQSESEVQYTRFYATEHLAVVHNGVIENSHELREELMSLGYEFESKTDSELILRLLGRYLDIGLSPKEAISVTVMRLHGFFAMIALFAGKKEQLIAARRGNPLAVGLGEEALYVSSDANTLEPISRQVMQLEEGSPAVLSSVISDQ
jgi:glutamine---fructose-6-phosphate transaminase (isomerizing)